MWDPTGEAGVPTVREVVSPVIGWYRRACGGGQSFSLFEMRTLNKFRAAQLRPSSSCFNLLWKVVVTLYNKSTTNRNEWCLSFNPFSLTLLLIVTKMRVYHSLQRRTGPTHLFIVLTFGRSGAQS